LPDPPAQVAALSTWVEKHSPEISFSNELLFFGVVLLLPAVISACVQAAKLRATAALLGCSSVMLALVLLATLVALEGRLVYPVFGIDLGPETVALVVSLFYAGLHTMQLLLGIGLIALGFGIRRTAGFWLLPLSVAVGVLQVAGAFPWLTPIWFNAAVTGTFFVWTVGIGYWLLRSTPGDSLRHMYAGGKPDKLARFLNRIGAAIFALGLTPHWAVALETIGRKSGKHISLPIVIAHYDHRDYLVSMLGLGSQWVLNVRAAGGHAFLHAGRRRPVLLEEVATEYRARILKAYLARAPGARPHIPVDRRDPVAEFETVSAEYPVFEIHYL